MLSGPSTTSIDALNRSARAYLRGVLIVCGVGLVVAVAGFSIAIKNRDALRSWYTEQFGAPTAEVLLGGLPGLRAMIAMFGGLVYVERRLGRDPHLLCPHCHKQLMQARHIVIASRNCPYCGRRAVADPPLE